MTPVARDARRANPVLWAGAAIALFAITYVLLLGNRANLIDEAWMLWVTRRLTHGDSLYSDVYFVSTPLAAWLSAGFARVGGVQLTVLRALQVVIFVPEFLIAISIAIWCRVRWPTLVLFGAALFVVASPVTDWISVYSSLAILFAIVALRVLLAWCDQDVDAGRRSPWLLVGVGVACGLSFGAKPNIGLLTLAAVVVGIWVIRRNDLEGQSLVRQEGLVAGGFVAPLVLVALPIVLSGAWNDFVSQVFADKGDYLRVGTSYVTTVGDGLDTLRTIIAKGGRPLDALHALMVLLPIFLTITVAWAVLRARGVDRRLVVFFAVFTAAALVGMFPLPGSNHLADVAPLAFAATLGAVTAARSAGPLSPRVRHAAYGLASAAVLTAMVVIVLHSIDGYSNRLVTRSAYPHFQNVPVPKRLRSSVEELRSFVAGSTNGRVFIATKDAGFWYLTTGTRDPLPFDIPEVSDFGAGGEQGVIRRLERGEATWVCVRPVDQMGTGRLEPRKIEHWVRTHLEFVESLSHCDMFRKPG